VALYLTGKPRFCDGVPSKLYQAQIVSFQVQSASADHYTGSHGASAKCQWVPVSFIDNTSPTGTIFTLSPMLPEGSPFPLPVLIPFVMQILATQALARGLFQAFRQGPRGMHEQVQHSSVSFSRFYCIFRAPFARYSWLRITSPREPSLFPYR
jgi:hypothetical protein